MRQYELFELRMQGPVLTENWAQAEVTAVFEQNGEKTEVKGFYDGDGVYRVRFLPLHTGTCHYRVTGAVSLEAFW